MTVLTKWYIHKPKSEQESGTHTILWDSKILTILLITVIKPGDVLKKKEFVIHRILPFQNENERKRKIDKYLEQVNELKKIKQRNMRMSVIPTMELSIKD